MDTEQLVKKSIKGYGDAFLQLIQTYKVDLYKTALSFLRNEDEVLEAKQTIIHLG